ncbi:hypothetical protein SHJG_p1007 (plasmid) [Streptomyces hygroscopicus subsp. jinggangensis 5008]|nr:hypothetical protein SHJG_p1007 [Streptomyces hygroscopicus subsp. jinggangensis 5008]AGF68292.1 hypothetical protein SHJGH_p1007 [Streptomyces hygroscopicus subsp. jinggangensis TL01]
MRADLRHVFGVLRVTAVHRQGVRATAPETNHCARAAARWTPVRAAWGYDRDHHGDDRRHRGDGRRHGGDHCEGDRD